MKYWNVKGSVATLKRQVLNNNRKMVNFEFRNLGISGIRFLISTDLNITELEKKELLFEI